MKSILFVLVTVYASAHAFGQIQVGVWTDKPSYQYGDTIAITITAYNPAADTVVLHFGSVCQASYIFDNFNLFDILMCPAILTSRSIPPSGTASWNALEISFIWWASSFNRRSCCTLDKSLAVRCPTHF